MKSRPLRVRAAARRDLESATDWYRDHAGKPVARRFVDAAETALGVVARSPDAGSPRFAHELDMQGLRTRMLRGFPYLVFYIVTENRVEVWRVLHAQRDFPATMIGEG